MHAPDPKRERKRARDRRRYQRELAGRAIASVEYSPEVASYLARYGWLREGDTVGDAIARMLAEAVEADEK